MKPESAAFIEHAHVMLERAERMLAAGLNEDSARCAYLACFHVAQALIFERVERVFKTHGGVQAEFSRLTKSDAYCAVDLRKFLSQAYDFKAVADYGIGADAVVSLAEAGRAIAGARRFVQYFSGVVRAGA